VEFLFLSALSMEQKTFLRGTVERIPHPQRDTAWVWLALGPAFIVLCGIGLGLLLVSLRKSNSLLAEPQRHYEKPRPIAQDPAANQESTPLNAASPKQVPSPPASRSGVHAATGHKLSLELLAGKWAGQTEADGVLNITIVSDGRLGYTFSDGCRERSEGRIQTREQTIYYFEHGERRPVLWWGFLDAAGQLHLQMDDDEEIYVLTREK